MLPSSESSGRDDGSHPYPRPHRPLSDKEEIARAALRSLADPSSSSAPSGDSAQTQRPPLPSSSSSFSATQLPPPHSSQPIAPHSPFTRRTVHYDYRHDDRAEHVDEVGPARPSAIAASYDQARSTGLADAAMSRDHSSSSFFQEKSIIASPDSSPKLEAASSDLPPLAPLPHSRHSVPSASVSGELHEVALRRASFALGVNLHEVRQIVDQAFASRRTSNSSGSASASASSHAYLPPSSVPEHASGFVRQVLDAYYLESDRASQLQPAYNSRRADGGRMSAGPYTDGSRSAAPSGMAYHGTDHPSDRSAQRQYRSYSDAWASRSDDQFPAYPTSSRSAYPAPHHAPHNEASAGGTSHAATMPAPANRQESPSPFAYDAYGRSSRPFSHESSQFGLRASQAYADEMAHIRGYERASDAHLRHPISPYSHQSPLPPFPAHDRRVRSIDDYLEQQQQHQQQHQQEQERRRNRRGSIAHYPGRGGGYVQDMEEDQLPDRNNRSVRSSYQPYPPPNTRYAPHPGQSPQLSPTTAEQSRYQHFSQLRSPRLRSPAAETAISMSSSVPSVAALSPSPLLGAVGSSSSLAPDDRKRSPSAADTDAQSSLRSVSADTAAETSAGVAQMHIDDDGSSSSQMPSSSKLSAPSRKSRSSRVSISQATRGSVPIAGTNLSRSEIMQKLQDKVRGRLAAKEKAAGNSSRGGKAASSSKAGKPARAGSTKRNAASISKSTAAASLQPQPKEGGEAATAEKSATQSGPGSTPAPKVRRTSAAPSQQPPAAKKSSSPAAQKSDNTTPSSIASALLSPTDTPTPSEAAATHAQRLSQSRSPVAASGSAPATVETADGQALPAQIAGAGQMNAASATKQQLSGKDSLVQEAQKKDPTETSSAIA